MPAFGIAWLWRDDDDVGNDEFIPATRVCCFVLDANEAQEIADAFNVRSFAVVRNPCEHNEAAGIWFRTHRGWHVVPVLIHPGDEDAVESGRSSLVFDVDAGELCAIANDDARRNDACRSHTLYLRGLDKGSTDELIELEDAME